ncbi:hypothetical protein ACS5PK_14110 [Roseateles sp. DB2]|uniref:hypothetical protein n=1 Tax=Roseateles sp. DB2 TaxID=3453717 RepID=UPI003EE85344
MSQAVPTVHLTPEERDHLWYMPQQPGGRIVPEHIQQRLQDLGLVTAPLADGQRGITVLGDKVRRGVL